MSCNCAQVFPLTLVKHRGIESDGIESDKTIRRFEMAIARVVGFTGVTKDRVEEMKGEMESGQPPEGLNATELMVLHDPETDESLAIVFFDNEEDYQRGHEILDAMPTGDTPGQRTSVTRYDVAIRMTP
jgi:hypothetical protein